MVLGKKVNLKRKIKIKIKNTLNWSCFLFFSNLIMFFLFFTIFFISRASKWATATGVWYGQKFPMPCLLISPSIKTLKKKNGPISYFHQHYILVYCYPPWHNLLSINHRKSRLAQNKYWDVEIIRGFNCVSVLSVICTRSMSLTKEWISSPCKTSEISLGTATLATDLK